MSERLIEKIDRLGAEAGIKEITPEIRRFALLVRQDTVAQWLPTAGEEHMTEDEAYDALSQKQLASIKRDTRISLEDAAVRATHKVMAEFVIHKIDSTGTAAVATNYYWIPIDKETPSGVTMWLINKASGVGQKGRHNPADKFFDYWFPLPIFTKDDK